MKFKKGDMVLLSSAGSKRHGNEKPHQLGGFGIVAAIHSVFDGGFPIEVDWWTADMHTFKMHFKPYELKFFKNK